jgi:hypothetical protein
MNINNSVRTLVAIAAIFVGLYGSPAQAQGPYSFNWTENKNGDESAILTTPSSSNNIPAITAITYTTSYSIEFTLNEDSLDIVRQNIQPTGPNAGSTYYMGPVQVTGGTTIDFMAWLNPSAQTGSSESIYDIMVNNIPLSETVTADSSNPLAQFQYVNPSPVTDIKFNYLINAVNGPSETGIGVDMITPTPEPTTLSILVLSFAAAIGIHRKKL